MTTTTTQTSTSVKRKRPENNEPVKAHGTHGSHGRAARKWKRSCMKLFEKSYLQSLALAYSKEDALVCPLSVDGETSPCTQVDIFTFFRSLNDILLSQCKCKDEFIHHWDFVRKYVGRQPGGWHHVAHTKSTHDRNEQHWNIEHLERIYCKQISDNNKAQSWHAVDAKERKEFMDMTFSAPKKAEKETVKVTEKSTDICRNPKCRSDRINYWQKQDRSADEPMTEYRQCLACGEQWKTTDTNTASFL